MTSFRPAVLIAIVAACVALANATSAAPPGSGHPILGTWTIALPEGNCSETYRFRSDGTTVVTSGEEVAESTYDIAAKPSRDGFYKWVDTIVKDNGRKDCSGAITEPGHAVTNYIRFDPSGEMMIVCQAESLDACFGPLRRVHGQDT